MKTYSWLDTIIEEGYAFYEGTNKIVDVLVASGTLLNVDAHTHDISESVPELAEYNVSSQTLDVHLSHL